MFKTVLVTGANKGIGYDTCKRILLHQPNFRVILTSRNVEFGKEAIEKLIKEISPKVTLNKDQLLYMNIDVSNDDSVKDAVNQLKSKNIVLNVLVNNAGYMSKNSVKNEYMSKDELNKSFDVNLFGVKRMTEHVLPLMNKTNGHIINVSSTLSKIEVAFDDSTNESKVQKFKKENLNNINMDDIFNTAQEYIKDGIDCYEKSLKDNNGGVHVNKELALDMMKQKGWPRDSYRMSKLLLNVYTQLKARELQDSDSYSRIRINSVCPGWCKSHIGGFSAPRTTFEGSKVIEWLASAENEEMLVSLQTPLKDPKGVVTGRFFHDMVETSF